MILTRIGSFSCITQELSLFYYMLYIYISIFDERNKFTYKHSCRKENTVQIYDVRTDCLHQSIVYHHYHRTTHLCPILPYIWYVYQWPLEYPYTFRVNCKVQFLSQGFVHTSSTSQSYVYPLSSDHFLFRYVANGIVENFLNYC